MATATTPDSRPRVEYVLPDGEVVVIIHDEGEEPKRSITFEKNGEIRIARRSDLASATAQIVAVLDALAISHDVLAPQLSLLPSADNYQEVDLAVRLWASTRSDVKVTEWGHWSRQPQGDDPGYWIEGYRVAASFRELCTVHTPQEHRTRMPSLPQPAPGVVIQLPVQFIEPPPPSDPPTADRESSPRDDVSARFSMMELD